MFTSAFTSMSHSFKRFFTRRAWAAPAAAPWYSVSPVLKARWCIKEVVDASQTRPARTACSSAAPLGIAAERRTEETGMLQLRVQHGDYLPVRATFDFSDALWPDKEEGQLPRWRPPPDRKEFG